MPDRTQNGPVRDQQEAVVQLQSYYDSKSSGRCTGGRVVALEACQRDRRVCLGPHDGALCLPRVPV